MREKRRFVRLDTCVKVEYRVVQSPQDKINSFTKNVSQGGICLVLDSSLPLNTMLEVTLFLPDKETISATGKIAWIEGFKIGKEDATEQYEAGIEFIDIAEEDVKKITKYVFGVLGKN